MCFPALITLLFAFLVGRALFFRSWRWRMAGGHGCRHHHHHHGCGSRWGRDDDDDHGHGRDPRWGRSGGFGGIGARLGLDGDEARVVDDAARNIGRSAKDAGHEVAQALDAVLDAFEQDGFDVDVAGESLARQREALDKVFQEVTGALGTLHTTLSSRERADLARTLRRALRRLG